MPEEKTTLSTRELQDKVQERQTGALPGSNNVSIPHVSEIKGFSNYIPRVPDSDESSQSPVIGARDILDATFERARRGNTTFSESYTEEALRSGYGRSRHDSGYYPGMDVENARALNQSAFNKVVSGLAKGGVTAATTALETTVGTVYGVLPAMFELANQLTDTEDGVKLGKVLNKGVVNRLSTSLIKLQQLSEEWFPNYRTTEERTDKYQREWWKHMGTANFIGDSFLKNFGFTVGAMAGGAAWTSLINKGLRKKLANDLLKASIIASQGENEAKAILGDVVKLVRSGNLEAIDPTKLAVSITEAAKAVNKADEILKFTGSLIGAMGEGTMEGIMARNEFAEDFTAGFDNNYRSEYANLQQEILDEGDSRFVNPNGVLMNPDGSMTKAPMLTPEGFDELKRRQQEKAQHRQEVLQQVNEQGENLARVTFLLNLPILTTSNAIQFGRMFSGGWTTAKKNVSKVATQGIKVKRAAEAGKYIRPEVSAEYSGIGNKVIKGVFNSLKVAGSESFEEMAQGTASSGTKAVAKARIAEFINQGYNAEAIGSVRDWFGRQMGIGASEYLTDIKNWQEGALGAITGLLGVPGRGYFKGQRGGVFEAIKDAGLEVNASNGAAAKLNQLVNSKEFQDRWHGYIRHLAYDADMERAVKDDEEYAWHNADDSQLTSDVISFAKAGRLNDLLDIVDVYANMTVADANSLKQMITDNSTGETVESDIANLTPQEIVSRVSEQAEKIKNEITEYKKVFDALSQRLPIGTDPDVLDEMLFTTRQIKNYEQRFFRMLNETLGIVNNSILDSDASKRERLESLRSLANDYARQFSDIVIPTKMPKKEYDMYTSGLNVLEELVEGDEQATKKVSDMRKLMDSRRDYYKKLAYLQTDAGQKAHEENKVTQDKIDQAADDEMSNAEMEGLNDFAEISRAYFEKKTAMEKSQFMKDLRKVRKNNAAADEFIRLRDAANGLRDYIKTRGYAPDKSGMTTSLGGNIGMYLEKLLNHAERNASSAEEFLSMSDDILPTRDEFNTLNNAPALEDKDNALMNRVLYAGNEDPNALYEQFKQIVRDTARAYSETKASNTPLENLSSSTQEAPRAPQAKQTGTDASQPGSVIQTSMDGALFGPPAEAPAAPQKQDGAPSEVNQESGVPGSERVGASEIADKPSKEEIEAEQEQAGSDFYDDEVDEINEGDNTNIGNAMPEIDSFEAKAKRENTRPREEIDLSDFAGPAASPARFKRKGDGTLETVAGNKALHKDYDESWVAFKDAGGFDAIVSQVRKGDKIEFGIDPSFPKDHEGRNQILMYITRNGERQVVGILGYNTSRTSYYNLRELRKAIMDEYDAMADKSQLFIFSKTSKVWAKRPGQFTYGKEKTLAQAGYQKGKSDGAIIFIDRNGNMRFVQGDKDVLSRIHLGKFNPADHRGHLYYLAPTGAVDSDNNPEYVPTRLDVEHFNEDTKKSVRPKFIAIRDILAKMVKVASEYANPSADNLDVQRRFYKLFTDLSKILDVHKIDMNVGEFPNTEVVGPALHIVDFNTVEGTTEKKHTFRTLDQLSVNWLIDQISSRDMALQVKQGADGTVTTDVDELIQQGHITTNLELVRAKGANFYILPWQEINDKTHQWGFEVATESQFESMERLERLEERGDEQPSAADEPLSGNDDDLHMDFDDDAPLPGEREVHEQEQTPEEIAEESSDALPEYNNLSEDAKKELEENGVTEEIYRNPTIDMRELIKQIIGCK